MEERKNDVNRLIDVFNDYTSTVFYQHNNIERSWDLPGGSKKIPLQEVYEVANTRGGRKLFHENMLLVKDSNAREYIGLKQLDKYNPTLDEIRELLKEEGNERLKEVLQYCSEITLEKIVKTAIDMPVASVSKGGLIHEYSGTAVLQVIEENRAKKAESGESTKEASDTDKPQRRERKVKN